MQLDPHQNSFGINGDHRNNMLIVATDIAYIIMPVATMVGCRVFTGLVASCSPKLGLTYLKIEVR
jgi:hypothetical protein